MPVEMISLRTFRLPTTTGHVLMFEADKPKLVPDDCVPAAMEKGCVPVDRTQIPIIEDMQRAKAEFSGDVRRSIIFLAIKSVAEQNDAKNFTGAGSPKPQVIAERVGFEVSANEVTDLFRQYMNARQEQRQIETHPQAQNALRVIDATSRNELLALCDELTPDLAQKAKGLDVKSLRKLLLSKFSGVTA